jgi:DNA-binding CsgD family transcriptional regulator/PAS domain-containing protein
MNESERSTDLHRAAHLAYAAATGSGSWESALDAMLAVSGFDGAALFVADKTIMPLSTQAPQPVHGLWRNLNHAAQDDYARHWFKHDPRFLYMLANPGQRILHDYLHTPEAQIDRDPYYAWYLRRQDTRYYIGGQSDPVLSFAAGLTLHRRGSKGAASDTDIATFTQLFAHVERALEIEYRLHRAAATMTDNDVAWQRNASGVVLLTRHLRVVHANPAARAIMARADALTLGATLGAMRRADHAALQKTLALAAAAGLPPPLRVARSTLQRDYIVTAFPVTPREGLFKDWSTSVCVLIADPDATPVMPEKILRQVFGLTAAEVRLLALLAGGSSVEQASQLLEVSQATIRTQLAALFRKTGTSRQGELIRLALALSWQIGSANP